MTTYSILIIVCGIIIYSYLADLVAKSTKIPSVLILLFSGMGLRWLVAYWEIKTLNFNLILPTLGTIGLIMIVFEGALELDYTPDKKRLIIRAFLSALIILLASALAIAGVFYFFTGQPFHICLLNAVPFSVISSAVAIPSASGLPHAKKEFIVYESSFSDILGIMFFNFMSTNQHFGLGSFAHLGLETIEILLISVLSCVALLYLLGRIKQRVKFVPIIALLILVYGVSRQWHLPSLVIVFMFGLFLKNIDLIKHPVVNRRLMYEHYHSDIHQLHQLSAESAFLLRTFFFVIFGFTISLTELATPEVLQYGLLAFLLIALIRYAGLRGVLREAPSPEWYLLPRGLISILLYYNIAEPLKISPYESSILLFVVLATNLLMSFGLVRYRAPQANE